MYAIAINIEWSKEGLRRFRQVVRSLGISKKTSGKICGVGPYWESSALVFRPMEIEFNGKRIRIEFCETFEQMCMKL